MKNDELIIQDKNDNMLTYNMITSDNIISDNIMNCL
jgi:hypothetical protein